MDISQAAFGLNMQSASRIYFIDPVLNPQIEAQAIGRARRISQKRPVSVETLVLKDSLEEVIVRRKQEMTQAEQRKCKSILDDKPIYEWILNAKITPLPEGEPDGPAQTAMLERGQLIFGRGFGRHGENPDEGLLALPLSSPRTRRTATFPAATPGDSSPTRSLLQPKAKRALDEVPNVSKKRRVGFEPGASIPCSPVTPHDLEVRLAEASLQARRRVHFEGDDE